MFIKTNIMSININLTEKEILDTPNDSVLGELVRNKFWQAKRNQEGPQYDDEHFGVVVSEDGLVKSIIRDYSCSICGQDTSNIEYDYLMGYDHISCVLEAENNNSDAFDKCVICGIETPYLKSTHIDYRVGYVEGLGQTCFQPNICDRV